MFLSIANLKCTLQIGKRTSRGACTPGREPLH